MIANETDLGPLPRRRTRVVEYEVNQSCRPKLGRLRGLPFVDIRERMPLNIIVRGDPTASDPHRRRLLRHFFDTKYMVVLESCTLEDPG